ncbi:hypothetical protein AGI3411_02762 [Achromobacter agilis]|uniref:Uncharacterized protein n=1 Tax=Achromobacter agilis TaxID=1353888 RepID=A0A446CG86_9BURK|nr:hypothetical protein AGI3411_02762 [Achromobacter agilis]
MRAQQFLSCQFTIVSLCRQHKAGASIAALAA